MPGQRVDRGAQGPTGSRKGLPLPPSPVLPGPVLVWEQVTLGGAEGATEMDEGEMENNAGSTQVRWGWGETELWDPETSPCQRR